jgi:carbon-monoxide dehydrogenase large subunit
VVRVFTLADFDSAYAAKRMLQASPNPAIKQNITQYPLARDEVCYVGEAIALVVAENRYIAEDAAQLVQVDSSRCLRILSVPRLPNAPGASRIAEQFDRLDRLAFR